MNSYSDSALVRPFRSIFRIFGAIFDAAYYFIDTLIHPSTDARNRRLTSSGQSSGGPRIGGFRSSNYGNAPNMSVGGCSTCS